MITAFNLFLALIVCFATIELLLRTNAVSRFGDVLGTLKKLKNLPSKTNASDSHKQNFILIVGRRSFVQSAVAALALVVCCGPFGAFYLFFGSDLCYRLFSNPMFLIWNSGFCVLYVFLKRKLLR